MILSHEDMQTYKTAEQQHQEWIIMDNAVMQCWENRKEKENAHKVQNMHIQRKSERTHCEK